MYFVLIHILQQFLYKAPSLHLCIAVILVFICYTISSFWQRQSTQLSCKFWAPHQVQLILWHITLQVEKLLFNGEVYVNKQFQNEMWGGKKITSEIKEGTRFKRRTKKHVSKRQPNTDVLNLIYKTAWHMLINPIPTVITFVAVCSTITSRKIRSICVQCISLSSKKIYSHGVFFIILHCCCLYSLLFHFFHYCSWLGEQFCDLSSNKLYILSLQKKSLKIKK